MQDDERDPISRRRFVTYGVAVGAASWVAPTIVTATRADATGVGSRPPKPPPTPATSPPQPMMGPPLPNELPPELPFTGQETRRTAELGASALATGAALWYLSKQERTT